MKYFVVLLCMVSKTVDCLSCYWCDSFYDEGCHPFNPSIVQSTDCNKYGFELDSQCVVYNYIEPYDNKIYTKRKCIYGLADNKSACNYIHIEAMQLRFKIGSCYTCTSDNCNSPDLKGGTKDEFTDFWRIVVWYVQFLILPVIGVTVIVLTSWRKLKHCVFRYLKSDWVFYIVFIEVLLIMMVCLPSFIKIIVHKIHCLVLLCWMFINVLLSCQMIYKLWPDNNT